MPVLLVSDTTVLIDLKRGGLLTAIFGLPFEFAVPDLLYEPEVRSWDGANLVELGLKVLSLDATAVEMAQTFRRREPRLSLPDAFAIALAEQGNHVVLAGDANLRQQADLEHVEVHGLLWVLDQLEQHRIRGNSDLVIALTQISSHARCRLPKSEVGKRLEKYRGR